MKNVKKKSFGELLYIALLATVILILLDIMCGLVYCVCDSAPNHRIVRHFMVAVMYIAISSIPLSIVLWLANRTIYTVHNFKQTFKFQNILMQNNNLMLFPDCWAQGVDFDFDTMLSDKSYQTMCGLPVTIDKIIRDTTKTTVLGVSGTMKIRGVKIRGIWDCCGNIVECQKMLQLTSPRNMFTGIDNIFSGTTESMFRLVSASTLPQE